MAENKIKTVLKPDSFWMAWGSATVLVVAILVSYRHIYWILGQGNGRDLWTYFGCVVGGFCLGPFFLAAMWLALGTGRLIARCQVVSFASVSLISAWCLGLLSDLDPRVGVSWLREQPVYFLGFLP
ncbi:MAG: hypothetical protein AAF939_12810, partial [Planctomycetota bacterium]